MRRKLAVSEAHTPTRENKELLLKRLQKVQRYKRLWLTTKKQPNSRNQTCITPTVPAATTLMVLFWARENQKMQMNEQNPNESFEPIVVSELQKSTTDAVAAEVTADSKMGSTKGKRQVFIGWRR